MKSFLDWFDECGLDRVRPWLILGKGPSFSRHREFDLRDFYRLSLNDAVRELPVDVAHAIDLHVIQRSGEAIAANARVLVMPWHPHIDFKPSAETLEDIALRQPVLGRLAAEGRLLWYNHSKTREHRPGSPIISVRYFSAEAALNLLVAAGVRTVRSLGVDGGAQYNKTFKDLSYRLLANRQPNFDRQFSEIAQTILRTGIDFAPLDLESPLRVLLRADAGQALPAKVLEYSIRKHTSMTTSVCPQTMSWNGRALYLEAGMLALKDLRGIWAMIRPGAQLQDLHDRCHPPEEFKDGVTVLLHYANPERQPWLCRESELGHFWVRDLVEAIDVGLVSRGLVEQEVVKGHARPSLLWQIEHRVADPRALPESVRSLDASTPWARLGRAIRSWRRW